LRYVVPLFEGRDAPALMVLLGWQNLSRGADQLGYREGSTALLASLDRVAASGAVGVMTYLYLGFEDPHDEAREIRRAAMVQDGCERLGLIHLIESRAVHHEQGADGQFRVDILQLHTRIASEIGADLIKTKYPGTVKAMATLVESCPTPIVIAGGPRMATVEDAYQVARDVVNGGGAGLVFGRNIYQSDDPATTLAQFRAIVHGEDQPHG
jgi:DhnA family fructose-bisphosphate aldolase class Ia